MGTEGSLPSHSIPQSCALEFISPPRPAWARALSVQVAQIEFSEHMKEMAVLGEEPGLFCQLHRTLLATQMFANSHKEPNCHCKD